MNAEITTERTQEEAAAVTLLKSTGIGVLVAAQVVYAVVARLRRGGYIASHDAHAYGSYKRAWRYRDKVIPFSRFFVFLADKFPKIGNTGLPIFRERI